MRQWKQWLRIAALVACFVAAALVDGSVNIATDETVELIPPVVVTAP